LSCLQDSFSSSTVPFCRKTEKKDGGADKAAYVELIKELKIKYLNDLDADASHGLRLQKEF
jgi:hypothetical protein